VTDHYAEDLSAMSLAELGEERGCDPFVAALDLLKEARCGLGAGIPESYLEVSFASRSRGQCISERELRDPGG
jgi:hypothetical protein